MNRLLATFVAAIVIALSAAPSALAQGKPSDNAAAWVGRWHGVKDWNGSEVTPYDGTAWWDLRSDGTFIDNSGESGTWGVHGVTFTMQYGAGGLTIFNGDLIADTVLGAMHNSDSSYTGIFAMRREE